MRDKFTSGVVSVSLMRIVLFAVVIATLFSSCCTVKEVPVQHRDSVVTKYVDRWHRDSVHVDRWRVVYDKGDTVWRVDSIVYIEWHSDTLFRDSIVRVRDSVAYPVEVEKLVERPVRGFFWWAGLVITFCVVSYVVYKLMKKPR